MRRGFRRAGSLLLLLSVVAAADKFPEYPVQRASQYASCQTRSGISIAIEPVSDGDMQKKYFGTKFESQGFLPVLVVLENEAADSGLLLLRDQITYHIGDSQIKGGSAGSPVVGSKAGQSVAAVAGVAMATGTVLGGSVPMMFIGLKMIAAASQVKQNILVRELRSQTISPGKTGSGFLYVPVGKPATEQRKVALNIALTLADRPDEFVFTFELDIPGGGNKK